MKKAKRIGDEKNLFSNENKRKRNMKEKSFEKYLAHSENTY